MQVRECNSESANCKSKIANCKFKNQLTWYSDHIIFIKGYKILTNGCMIGSYGQLNLLYGYVTICTAFPSGDGVIGSTDVFTWSYNHMVRYFDRSLSPLSPDTIARQTARVNPGFLVLFRAYIMYAFRQKNSFCPFCPFRHPFCAFHIVFMVAIMCIVNTDHG